MVHNANFGNNYESSLPISTNQLIFTANQPINRQMNTEKKAKCWIFYTFSDTYSAYSNKKQA